MVEFAKHEHGTFCWFELITPDAAGAKKFYDELFGWTHHDDEVAPGMLYTIFMKNGKNVGAMFQRSAEMEQAGVPPHWGCYVNVEDLDATAAKAKELGGTINLGPMDVMEAGRMLGVLDPTGAHVMFWQAKQHIGAQLRYEPGSVCWNELMTNDTAKAAAFYGPLLGWTQEIMPMPQGEYTVYKAGEQFAGGMMAIDPNWGPVPPHWATYMEVEDCDATCAKAEELGGAVVAPAQDVEGVGRFAMIRDPQGAHIGVIKSAAPAG